MNLDELQSVRARERQSSDLQHLRPSFYAEVGEYIGDLREERAEAVDRVEDPFSSSTVRQLTDDIETAESTVEAIYERRVGKVVKKASIAAAGMPVDDDGLTAEETALFETLVERIERNRETVMATLDGEASPVSCSIDDAASDVSTASAGVDSPSDVTEPPEDTGTEGGVSAADLMGRPDTADRSTSPSPETAAASPEATPETADPAPDREDVAEQPDPHREPNHDPVSNQESESSSPRRPATDDAGAGRSAGKTAAKSDSDVPGIPRTTVRITADVGEVVGADDRDYDLGREDVVTLPEANAAVLVDNDAAERLE